MKKKFKIFKKAKKLKYVVYETSYFLWVLPVCATNMIYKYSTWFQYHFYQVLYFFVFILVLHPPKMGHCDWWWTHFQESHTAN